MEHWARYYVEFVIKFCQNIWYFVSGVFEAIIQWLFKDVIQYLKDMVNASGEFKFFDWVCFVLVFIINAAFITFCVLRLIQYIRRRRRYKVKNLEKEDLLEEIETLNYKIEELVVEKNQILGIRAAGAKYMRGTGVIDEDEEDKPEEKKNVSGESRFVKLIGVDKKYEFQITNVNMTNEDLVSLPALVERFINFSASQLRLFYDKKIISAFFAGLATSKIMILEGISGTGKTSLPYVMGKFFGNDSAIVSVQPSWRDRQEILGYLNEFTKKFNETDFLKALYETTYREDLNFIVLDEMNLARIEYYFAEFLSIMEMPDQSEWKIDLVSESLPTDPKNLVNGKILVPQNVWFIGTANKDDSTFTITDKVYDRATIIEMDTKAKFIDAPYTEGITMSYEYLDGLFEKAQEECALDAKSIETIGRLDRFIVDNLKVTFGNRIMKQLKAFVPVYVACGGSEIDGIDSFVCRKVLRKFEGLNLSFLHKELNDLIAFLDKLYGKNACPECIEYIKELIKNS